MALPLKFKQLATQGFGFAVFPEVRIFESPGVKSKQHLLFGDYITPPKNEDGTYKKWTGSLLQQVGEDFWVNVRSRQEEGWIRLKGKSSK